MLPKLFTPAVACPCFCYPNDESFRFCQQCGYQRTFISNTGWQDGRCVKIDEELIERM